MISIDFAIATHRPEGILRLADCGLPALEGVRYVVSWQSHDDAPIPQSLQRADVEIHRFSGRGLSANRNNAIDHCRADVVAFADDDLTFFADAIKELQRAYDDNPDIDLIVSRAILGKKQMPDSRVQLNGRLPRGFYVSSIELSFRRRCNLRCCPDLGLGSPTGIDGGEDEALFATALHRGFNCCYFPITTCRHEHLSTGQKSALTKGNLLASGCVIALTYSPLQALLRIPLKAWRVWRSGRATLGDSLSGIIGGALKAPSLRRRNRKYLW